MVTVADLSRPTPAEKAALQESLQTHNLALYAGRPTCSKSDLRALGREFGLQRLDNNLCADDDAITSLRVKDSGKAIGYIPYSNRPLNWHTDGYYNTSGETIRAWALHCAQPAASGGANQLLDPEIAYILLRDKDPQMVAALMHPEAMTIPENEAEQRPAQSGPVFSIDPDKGTLHMRYTARTRSIVWRNTQETKAAVRYLQDLFADGHDSIYEHRLQAGQGVISNNVLHNRSGFSDDEESGQRRLLYRARYYDRVAGTELRDLQTNWG